MISFRLTGQVIKLPGQAGSQAGKVVRTSLTEKRERVRFFQCLIGIFITPFVGKRESEKNEQMPLSSSSLAVARSPQKTMPSDTVLAAVLSCPVTTINLVCCQAHRWCTLLGTEEDEEEEEEGRCSLFYCRSCALRSWPERPQQGPPSLLS